jgi:hypothetical protein
MTPGASSRAICSSRGRALGRAGRALSPRRSRAGRRPCSWRRGARSRRAARRGSRPATCRRRSRSRRRLSTGTRRARSRWSGSQARTARRRRATSPRRVIDAGGGRCGIVGTLGYRFEDLDLPASHTSPEADELARVAAAMRARGATHLVMEVSSIAIAAARVEAVHFRAGAFTNLTQDHLDYHGTMDAYAAAKERLFTDLATEAAAVNVDDAFGARLAEKLIEAGVEGARADEVELCPSSPVVRLARFSAKLGARGSEIAPLELSHSPAGIAMVRARTPAGKVTIRSPLHRGAQRLEPARGALDRVGPRARRGSGGRGALRSDPRAGPARALRRAGRRRRGGARRLRPHARRPRAGARERAGSRIRADVVRLRLRRRPGSEEAVAHGRGRGARRRRGDRDER